MIASWIALVLSLIPLEFRPEGAKVRVAVAPPAEQEVSEKLAAVPG